MNKNPPYKTILAQQPKQQNLKPNHPFLYYQDRNEFLSALSDKYSAQCRLPTLDLKKNARIDYYLDRYEALRKQKQREEKKNSCYLDSNQFNTVFADCVDQRRTKNRQKIQEQRLKQDLYRMYLAQQTSHGQPQHDGQMGEQPVKYETVLTDYRTDPIKQKQLYLLDLEIGKLRLQEKIEKKVRDNKQMCRNQQLLSKLSNQILSSYMVHFDQIYNLLIDQILTDEVYYLNYIEAQYKVEKSEYNTKHIPEDKIRYENAKTIQMMDLVKRLQDLCDN